MLRPKVKKVKAHFDNGYWKLTLTLKRGSAVTEEVPGSAITADPVIRHSVISDYLKLDYDLDDAEWDFGGK